MLVLVLNRHAFDQLVGKILLSALIALDFGRRIHWMLVVVRVFALIWLGDSLCGLLVMPEKLSAKVLPKRRLLYDKKEAQNSIFNSIGHILAFKNGLGRYFVRLKADSEVAGSVSDLNERCRVWWVARGEEKKDLHSEIVLRNDR